MAITGDTFLHLSDLFLNTLSTYSLLCSYKKGKGFQKTRAEFGPFLVFWCSQTVECA